MPYTDFENNVFDLCSKIKKGQVSTYAEIARAIGNSKASRAVGNALNKNPYKHVPCHRIVCSDGRIGGFAHGSRKKQKMLESEGIEIKNRKIKDFEKVFQRLV